MPNPAEFQEKTVDHEGRHLRFSRYGHWEFVERQGVTHAVVIVAITDEEKILFVEQYRPPVQSRVIELPAGLAGDTEGAEEESMETAARRELVEETGYEASDWEQLAEGPVSPGMSTEYITLFLAAGLRRVGEGGGDEHEEITLHEVSLAELDEWLDRKRGEGCLIDPKIFSGLYFVKSREVL